MNHQSFNPLYNLVQVEYDAKAANKIADENEEISREDFFKFAIDTKLLDFGCVIGEGSVLQKQKKPPTPSKEAIHHREVKTAAAKVIYKDG